MWQAEPRRLPFTTSPWSMFASPSSSPGRDGRGEQRDPPALLRAQHGLAAVSHRVDAGEQDHAQEHDPDRDRVRPRRPARLLRLAFAVLVEERVWALVHRRLICATPPGPAPCGRPRGTPRRRRRPAARRTHRPSRADGSTDRAGQRATRRPSSARVRGTRRPPRRSAHTSVAGSETAMPSPHSGRVTAPAAPRSRSAGMSQTVSARKPPRRRRRTRRAAAARPSCATATSAARPRHGRAVAAGGQHGGAGADRDHDRPQRRGQEVDVDRQQEKDEERPPDRERQGDRHHERRLDRAAHHRQPAAPRPAAPAA